MSRIITTLANFAIVDPKMVECSKQRESRLRERDLLFEALAQFMKRSALQSINEIVG